MLAGRGGGGRGGFKLGGKKKDEGPKMKKIHWETLKSTEGTIWGDLGHGAEDGDADATALFPDLKDNFEITSTKPRSASTSNSNRSKVVSLIDGKRSQNMNIMLAQFGKKEFKDIAEACYQLDDEFIGEQRPQYDPYPYFCLFSFSLISPPPPHTPPFPF